MFLLAWPSARQAAHVSAGFGQLRQAGVGAPSFPTRSFVLRHLRQVAKRCEPGDWPLAGVDKVCPGFEWFLWAKGNTGVLIWLPHDPQGGF